MLHASHDAVIASVRLLPLVAPHHGLRHAAAQEGVLAAALGHAAPPLVYRHVHHGGEGPADAVGRALPGGHAGGPLDGLHVPRGGQREGDGEHGLVAVYHVHAHYQRYAQPGAADGDVLQGAYLLHALHVEHAAQPAPRDVLPQGGADRVARGDVARGHQVQLPYFLLYGHLGHQLVDELVHPLLPPGLRAGEREGGGHHKNGKFAFAHSVMVCIG